jgi:RNA ligase (TIGR02306 family)
MKLATVEKIAEVKKHPDADRLDLVKILGYQCVAQRGLYTGGETIIFIQPDTVLPEEDWTEEYRKYSPKRIKAVKLRGEWSEGIIVPLDIVSHRINSNHIVSVGTDVGDQLGVTKYEAPLPSDGSAIGGLPFGIPKTDEERFENLVGKLPLGEKVDITLKIDGQSVTYFYNVNEDRFGVTGRNYEVPADSPNRYSIHVDKVRDKIVAFCKANNVSLAFRGESYGNGIQKSGKNPHSQLPSGFACFNIYKIEEREYAHKGDKFYYEDVCNEIGIETVPMVEKDVELTESLIKKYSVDLKKLNGQPFEGVVVKHSTDSFKIINKTYDSSK